MKVVDNEHIELYKLELDVANTGHITNCYVIKDKETTKVCVIDPAFDEQQIKKIIQDIKGDLEIVIITHCHADHIAALSNLVKNTNARVYIHEQDYVGLYNKELNAEEIVGTKIIPVEKEMVVGCKEKDEIAFGGTILEVIHTPGHTKGSITVYDKKNKLLYSGDTIFSNSYGRTDLSSGSREDMKESLDKLFDRFEDIFVLPGHGEEFNLKNSKRKIRLLFAYKG